MKIGVDARPLNSQLTGIGIYLKNLLDELQKIDHHNYYYLISNTQINYELKNSRWSKVEGHLRGRFVSTFWTQVFSYRVAKKLALDVCWGTRHHLPLFLPRNVRTVLTVHDIVHILYPWTMSLPNLILERLLMRFSVKKADHIICDSQSTALGVKEAYSKFHGDIETVYPGTPPIKNCCDDFDGFLKSLPDKYFLFVGTLEPRKNFLRILNAFQDIDPLYHGVHLVAVGGKGWKNKEIIKILKREPFKNHVHLTGYVRDGELKLLYEKALCLLFPSLYEGFGFPILESMSCFTPVVTSNVSSMPEIAGEAAILIDPFNTYEIEKAMFSILQDQTLRKALSEKGFRRSKEFSWFQCANQIIHVFEIVARKGKQNRTISNTNV